MIQEHWEKVYETKSPQEVSWTQNRPDTSLEYIAAAQLDLNDPIIDIGGGDSLLVDFLLDLGHSNITVLDISQKAIERAQKRLGHLSNKVTWVVSNVVDFCPTHPYALWHDRAAFHFLTKSDHIEAYTQLVNQFVTGHLVMGTFSKKGPLKCSGLEITQYDPEDIQSCFAQKFKAVSCKTETHITPFNTEQNFSFCHLKRATDL